MGGSLQLKATRVPVPNGARLLFLGPGRFGDDEELAQQVGMEHVSSCFTLLRGSPGPVARKSIKPFCMLFEELGIVPGGRNLDIVI